MREVLARAPDELVLSVSATTRPPRAGEADGVDYYFVDEAGFDRMVGDGEMLEWAEVFHGHRYGAPWMGRSSPRIEHPTARRAPSLFEQEAIAVAMTQISLCQPAAGV